jgi:hypothetical protein
MENHKKGDITPVTTKVKGLISGEVSMGTYGLVELEVRNLEESKNNLLEALIELRKKYLFNQSKTQAKNNHLDETLIKVENEIRNQEHK